jgi:hypothetical protein
MLNGFSGTTNYSRKARFFTETYGGGFGENGGNYQGEA